LKKIYYEIAVPWPEGILISLFGGGGSSGLIVGAKELAEMRKKAAKTGEKIRIIRTFQK
jgi:hypothetical protein